MEYNEHTMGPAIARTVASSIIDFLKQKNPNNKYFAKRISEFGLGLLGSCDYGETIRIKERAPRGIRKVFPRTVAKMFYASTYTFLNKFKTYAPQLISAGDLERLTSTEGVKRAHDCILLSTHTTV